jgi:DNA mismatch repair ATPase MutS
MQYLLYPEKKLYICTLFPKNDNLIKIQRIWHPSLKKPISNDIKIYRDKNVIFLTGANMAGKSTLMKSFGIAIYLSHMGFPIAAKNTTISL